MMTCEQEKTSEQQSPQPNVYIIESLEGTLHGNLPSWADKKNGQIKEVIYSTRKCITTPTTHSLHLKIYFPEEQQTELPNDIVFQRQENIEHILADYNTTIDHPEKICGQPITIYMTGETCLAIAPVKK